MVRPASRLHDCSVRNRANFREKTRERAANFVDFGAMRMQNSAGACGVCCATRTVSPKLSGESALRLVTRLRDVGVRNRAILREKRENIFMGTWYCNDFQHDTIFIVFGTR